MSPCPRLLFVVSRASEARPNPEEPPQGLPREKHWGLALLQERRDLQVTPWFPERRRLQQLAERLLPQRQVFWSKSLAVMGWQLAAMQRRYDVVFSVNNAATATLLALRKERGFQPKIACLLIGVADWLERADPESRQQTVEYLALADRLLALGTAEVDYLQACGLARARFLPFGVDTEYWAPTGEPVDDYVFAVGSDPCRDFDSLIQACPYPLKIMTRSRHLITVPIPAHVSLVQGDIVELRRLYARARVVVVPLRDSLQPSGQNTILQAMAMGKPVVLTRTRGTWTDKLSHGQNCLFVRPRDPRELSAAIRSLFDLATAEEIGKQARSTVKAYYDASNLADTVAASARQLVAI